MPNIRSQIERYYPIFFGVIFAIFCSSFLIKYLPQQSQQSQYQQNFKELFTATTTLSGIAIGFLAAAMSMLLTICEVRFNSCRILSKVSADG